MPHDRWENAKVCQNLPSILVHIFEFQQFWAMFRDFLDTKNVILQEGTDCYLPFSLLIVVCQYIIIVNNSSDMHGNTTYD